MLLTNDNFTAALTVWSEPVPEPSTWLMMAVGFVSLGFAGYCTRARVAAAA